VCCPPGSEAQIEAVVAEMVKDLKCDPVEARAHVAWILNHATLAPKSFGKVLRDLSELKPHK
jgi:hypothetical protein